MEPLPKIVSSKIFGKVLSATLIMTENKMLWGLNLLSLQKKWSFVLMISSVDVTKSAEIN